VRKIWDIHGGIHPPENKIQSSQDPIGSIPLAGELNRTMKINGDKELLLKPPWS